LLESLKKLAADHGVESQVSFLGQMSRDAALKQIAGADLFVLPSRFEGFGMVAVEAMMLGVPTITANFPASAEYIEQGVTGHNFPVGDKQRLADLIGWHIDHAEDALKIGRAGRLAVSERYQPQNIASIHLELYQRCLKNS